jgi:hypothetical protein
MAQVTRLGLYGGPRRVYGPFDKGVFQGDLNLISLDVEVETTPVSLETSDPIEVRITI